jgi:hypothetical protein
MIKEYKDKIIADGDQETMEHLGNMFVEVMYKLKEYNEKCFDEYAMELHVMAYGETLTEDMAKDIVRDMKPYGEHWTIEQTTSVREQYGIDVTNVDFYVVMNMAWNDYNEVFGEDLETYVKFSKAFIKDEDAKEGKVFRYFTM